MKLLGDNDADQTGSSMVISTPNIFINMPALAEAKTTYGRSSLRMDLSTKDNML
jgi:hypothetical protein